MIRAIVISLTATAVLGTQGGDAVQQERKFEDGAFVHKTGFCSGWFRKTWKVVSYDADNGKYELEEHLNEKKKATVAQSDLKRVQKTYVKGTPVIFKEEDVPVDVGIIASKLDKFEVPSKLVKLNVGNEEKKIPIKQILMAYFPLDSNVVKKDDKQKTVFKIQRADVKKQYKIRHSFEVAEICQDIELALEQKNGKPSLSFEELQEKFENFRKHFTLDVERRRNSTDLKRAEQRIWDVVHVVAPRANKIAQRQLVDSEARQPRSNVKAGERQTKRRASSIQKRNVRFEDKKSGVLENAKNFMYNNPKKLIGCALGLGAAAATACLMPTGEKQEEEQKSGNASGYSTATKAAAGVVGTVGALTGLYKLYKNRKSEPTASQDSCDTTAFKTTRTLKKGGKSSYLPRGNKFAFIGGALALLLLLAFFLCRKGDENSEKDRRVSVDLEMGLQEVEKKPEQN